jgi:hypothetical protein
LGRAGALGAATFCFKLLPRGARQPAAVSPSERALDRRPYFPASRCRFDCSECGRRADLPLDLSFSTVFVGVWGVLHLPIQRGLRLICSSFHSSHVLLRSLLLLFYRLRLFSVNQSCFGLSMLPSSSFCPSFSFCQPPLIWCSSILDMCAVFVSRRTPDGRCLSWTHTRPLRPTTLEISATAGPLRIWRHSPAARSF